jgi:hypothetical protein
MTKSQVTEKLNFCKTGWNVRLIHLKETRVGQLRIGADAMNSRSVWLRCILISWLELRLQLQ